MSTVNAGPSQVSVDTDFHSSGGSGKIGFTHNRPPPPAKMNSIYFEADLISPQNVCTYIFMVFSENAF